MNKTCGRVLAAGALALGACAFPAPLPVAAMPEAETPTCPRLWPTQRVKPPYPRDALDARQDGWVLVEFDLPPDGVPRNLRVFRASPPGIFDEAAVKAVRNFRYPTGDDFKGCLADLVFKMR